MGLGSNLYKAARILGDVNAVKKLQSGQACNEESNRQGDVRGLRKLTN